MIDIFEYIIIIFDNLIRCEFLQEFYGVPIGSKVGKFNATKYISRTKINISATKINISRTNMIFISLIILIFDRSGTPQNSTAIR